MILPRGITQRGKHSSLVEYLDHKINEIVELLLMPISGKIFVLDAYSILENYRAVNFEHKVPPLPYNFLASR